MIFATVGTIPFERLVQAVDTFAEQCPQKVVIQGAIPRYEAKNAEYHEYLADIQTFVQNADIIISHCGVGTVYEILRAGKPAVIVPRRSHLGEHYNDHQWEMACKLGDRLPFAFVDDIGELPEAVAKCKACQQEKRFESTRARFLKALREDVSLFMSS